MTCPLNELNLSSSPELELVVVLAQIHHNLDITMEKARRDHSVHWKAVSVWNKEQDKGGRWSRVHSGDQFQILELIGIEVTIGQRGDWMECSGKVIENKGQCQAHWKVSENDS